jgi:hypothetical protein
VTSGRGHLVVEGKGETRAALNLITRLWNDLGLAPLHWDDPIRGIALHTRNGVDGALALVRRKPGVRALLMLRDEDDACPKVTAPAGAGWIASAGLPFPVALVLLRREYETLLLPSLHRMAGVALVDPRGVRRPGVLPGAKYDGDPEAVRDAKGVLTDSYVSGRYKPNLDQLALTQLVDFDDIRAAGVPAFGTLERALRFLSSRLGQPGTYPPPR